MKFNPKDIFAPDVFEGEIPGGRGTGYWLNGTGEEHSAFLKLMGDDKKKQMGFEKAVYFLACDEKGKHLYKGQMTVSDFHKTANRGLCRAYASVIMGLSDEDEKTVFDSEVEETVKKSGKVKEDTTA